MSKKISVILLKNQPKLGNKNAVIEVSPGYARNYLLPQKIAVLATPEALKKIETDKQSTLEHIQKQLVLLQPVLVEIGKKGIEFAELANENNQLFGSINEETIKKKILQTYPLDLGIKEFKVTIGQGKEKKENMGPTQYLEQATWE